PELINDNIDGFLVNAKSSDEIADKILELYNNKETLNEVSKNCYQKVLEKYDWSAIAKETEHVLKQTL
ncbi:hypothetical protein NSP09_24470, partial [Salmonella enterica]|nr:hypothetical protein [Salmonella enterica]